MARVTVWYVCICFWFSNLAMILFWLVLRESWNFGDGFDGLLTVFELFYVCFLWVVMFFILLNIQIVHGSLASGIFY